MLHSLRGAFVMESEKGIRCKSVAASTTVNRGRIPMKQFVVRLGYSNSYPYPQPIIRHAASLRRFKSDKWFIWTYILEKARDMRSVSQETCHNNYR